MAKLLWFSLNEIKTLMFAVFAFESNGNHRVLIREHFRSFSLTSKRESFTFRASLLSEFYGIID